MRAHALRLIAVAAFVLAGFACSKDESAPADSGNNGFGPSDPSGSSSGSSSGSPNNPANAPFVTVSNETMEFDGKTRSYILAKPENYDANKSYPLVLSFHGNPGDAKGMANGLPFDSVSKSDAVIAYPQGDNDNWDLYTPTDGNADMGFIKALPDEIKTKLNIDASKVFGFGYSGGAFFLTQFTCRFGGFFRAISINSGGGPDEAQMGYGKYPNGCYQCPGGPIATLVTHGASDTEVEPGSGEFTQACYATFNGCDDSLSDTTPSPCQQHDNCPAGKPVKWCLIPGQGHEPWKDAMKEAWSFFNAVP